MSLEVFAILKILILTTLAFVVAMASTPLLSAFLYRFKLGKQIRDVKSAPIMAKLHAKKAGTPTMGGLLVWGTVLFLAVICQFYKPLDFITRSETLLPLGALVASALVGLLDDYFNVKRIGPHGGGLRMRHRLLIYTAIAAVGAWWFFIKLDWDIIHVPLLGDFSVGWWSVPIFLFIIVATSFSVNQTDGLDGLAGGTLLTSFAAVGGIAFLQGRYDLAAFCGVLIGALLAFLWFNINPARFFMGDTGSMSLGVTLAIMAMLTNAVLLLPIIGFIFVLESVSTLLQIGSKKIFHRKLFLSSPIHHHLEAIGWSEPKIVMRFWVISIVAAGLGFTIALLDHAIF